MDEIRSEHLSTPPYTHMLSLFGTPCHLSTLDKPQPQTINMLSDDITAEECFRRLSGVGGGGAAGERDVEV